MSFSLRETVAEGRMRGGGYHLAVRPLILSFSPRGEGTRCRLLLVVQSEKVCPGEVGRGSGRERTTMTSVNHFTL